MSGLEEPAVAYKRMSLKAIKSFVNAMRKAHISGKGNVKTLLAPKLLYLRQIIQHLTKAACAVDHEAWAPVCEQLETCCGTLDDLAQDWGGKDFSLGKRDVAKAMAEAQKLVTRINENPWPKERVTEDAIDSVDRLQTDGLV